MTGRLQAAGVRPISPLVDITNYVLLELGHPLHAFDLDTLAGGALRIRRATAGERLTTLDGVARTLDAEMLVIADRDRAQAVAGVMGGGDIRGLGGDAHGGVRERVLQAGVGPPNEQAAGPQDRGVVALRAGRRHQRSRRRARSGRCRS